MIIQRIWNWIFSITRGTVSVPETTPAPEYKVIRHFTLDTHEDALAMQAELEELKLLSTLDDKHLTVVVYNPAELTSLTAVYNTHYSCVV